MTRQSWLIGTKKNLWFSNLFYLSILQEGKATADANSRQFNIEPEKDKTQSPSPSNSTPSPTPSNTLSPSSVFSQLAKGINPNPGTPTNTSTAGRPENNASSNSWGSSETNNSDSFRTNEKVGVIASLPVAVILSVGLIAFLLKRRKDNKRQGSVPIVMEAPPIQEPHKYYHSRPGSYHYYGANIIEAPSNTYDDPIELGAAPQARAKLVAAPVRYEM